MQDWRYLRFEKNTRYYELRLERDLLGDWVISAVNGQKYRRLGKITIFCYENQAAAYSALEKMIDYRTKNRKYYCIQDKLAAVA